ncbi:hypothetical protein GCM10029964_090420 [Kibdelosporangium lantanae]
MDLTERAPRPGERCTCGRPAVVVYLTADRATAWCGQSGGPPITPCPFCGSPTPHTDTYGDRAVCPDYPRPKS